MNKKRILWFIAGLYLFIIVSLITIIWLTNQQHKFVIDYWELKAGLRILKWILLALTGGLVILTKEILQKKPKAKVEAENTQEIVETSPQMNSIEVVTEQTIEEQEDTEKKEIMTVYLSSGDSFLHEIESMKLSSQEIIDLWKSTPLSGELIVEDSDGWSAYKIDRIAAITILFE